MMLFPMKAKHFVWVLALIELMTTLYSSGGPWASVAHLGGMGAGFFLLWIQARISRQKKNKNSSTGRRKKRSANHLKLIHSQNLAQNPAQKLDLAEGDSEDEGPKTWH